MASKNEIKNRLYNSISFSVVDSERGDVYSSYHQSVNEAYNHMDSFIGGKLIVVMQKGENIIAEVDRKGRKINAKAVLPKTVWSGSPNVHYTPTKI